MEINGVQTALPGTGGGTELKKACDGFEAYFLQYLFKEMRKSEFSGGFTAKSPANRVYTEMLDGRYADLAAGSGGFGLSDFLYKQLTAKHTNTREQNIE